MGKKSEKKSETVLASGIACYCAHDALVDVTALVPNPKNPNRHPDSQIALLAKIIRAQGWRNPIVVSNRSGFMTKGHGRAQAAAVLQVEQVPVDYQDYENEAAEWADMVADNRIAELAEMDHNGLVELLGDLKGINFDMELAGFDAMELERVLTAVHVEGENNVEDIYQGMPEFTQEEILAGAVACLVRFKSNDDRLAFEKFLGYKLSHKGKNYSTWYPKPDFDQLGAKDGAKYVEGAEEN